MKFNFKSFSSDNPLIALTIWLSFTALFFIIQVKILDYVEHELPTMRDYHEYPLKNRNCTVNPLNESFWLCQQSLEWFGLGNEKIYLEAFKKAYLENETNMLIFALILSAIVTLVWVVLDSKYGIFSKPIVKL